jgi:hypothetical protein
MVPNISVSARRRFLHARTHHETFCTHQSEGLRACAHAGMKMYVSVARWVSGSVGRQDSRQVSQGTHARRDSPANVVSSNVEHPAPHTPSTRWRHCLPMFAPRAHLNRVRFDTSDVISPRNRLPDTLNTLDGKHATHNTNTQSPIRKHTHRAPRIGNNSRHLGDIGPQWKRTPQVILRQVEPATRTMTIRARATSTGRALTPDSYAEVQAGREGEGRTAAEKERFRA